MGNEQSASPEQNDWGRFILTSDDRVPCSSCACQFSSCKCRLGTVVRLHLRRQQHKNCMSHIDTNQGHNQCTNARLDSEVSSRTESTDHLYSILCQRTEPERYFAKIYLSRYLHRTQYRTRCITPMVPSLLVGECMACIRRASIVASRNSRVHTFQ